MIFDKSGSLANTKRHDHLPFGEELIAGQGLRTTTLGYLADNMRQKFTSKQRDNETGLDYFGARYYASVQGRFTSPDAPFADQFAENPQSWNLYSYVRNIPLIMIDPTGRRTGDYYYRDGTWAYTDNLRDDKVYVLNETTEGDGSVNLTPQLLGKTHTQFRIIANIVRQEAGTSDAEENLWIAHTSNNEASATHVSLYDLLQSRFSSAGDKTSGIATTDSSVRANSARAGVIDVLAGGHDPTGGARRWDGTDFLAWGLKGPYGSHAKFREYTTIDIPGNVYSTYESAQRARWGNSVTYYGTKYTLPAAVFTNNANWTAACDFHYVTGARNATRGLTATGARGQTIFWRF
jgi:RHS repeat-associated protein